MAIRAAWLENDNPYLRELRGRNSAPFDPEVFLQLPAVHRDPGIPPLAFTAVYLECHDFSFR